MARRLVLEAAVLPLPLGAVAFLPLETVILPLPLEAAVLQVAIALEDLIPFPLLVLPMDTHLDIHLATAIAVALPLPLALERGAGLP